MVQVRERLYNHCTTITSIQKYWNDIEPRIGLSSVECVEILSDDICKQFIGIWHLHFLRNQCFSLQPRSLNPTVTPISINDNRTSAFSQFAQFCKLNKKMQNIRRGIDRKFEKNDNLQKSLTRNEKVNLEVAKIFQFLNFEP